MGAAKRNKKKPPKKPEPVFEYPGPLNEINKLPANDHAVADRVCADLAAGGAERIEQLIGFVGEPGDDKGVKPRYALHALASYCSRPEADGERKLFARTLARQLEAKHSPEVKAFLVEQLQLAGTPAEVPALEKWIVDARVGLPAISALAAIGDETAAVALRKALRGSSGRHRVGVIQALGRLRDAEATAALLKDAAAKDRDIRLAAVYALANIGGPAAIDTVKGALEAKSAYEWTQAVDACLLLAQRLAEQDKTKAAKALYQHLLDTCTQPHQQHVRHAAEEGLKALAE